MNPSIVVTLHLPPINIGGYIIPDKFRMNGRQKQFGGRGKPRSDHFLVLMAFKFIWCSLFLVWMITMLILYFTTVLKMICIVLKTITLMRNKLYVSINIKSKKMNTCDLIVMHQPCTQGKNKGSEVTTFFLLPNSLHNRVSFNHGNDVWTPHIPYSAN